MITVRKAVFSDVERIAAYILLAMKEIVFKFIGEEDETKAMEFMLHLVAKDNNQYSYQNCWVAEDDGDVVGAILVYHGAQLYKLRQPVIEYLSSRFNKALKSEDETQPGEYYIDSLGVRPDQQGKGTGTKLLQHVIDEYVMKHNHTLGLLVDEMNPYAKRLYLTLGFKHAGKKILFGKKMDHLQIKR